MFSGIVEALGKVSAVKKEKGSVRFTIEARFTSELEKGQSISHNGVCLTVTALNKKNYSVTAIAETLKRSNLGELRVGSFVNLERCLKVNDRLDGHLVQGHVDCTAVCTSVKKEKGSVLLAFRCEGKNKCASIYLIEKGSVCVNGISFTVVSAEENNFSVAIIPYTLKNTNLRSIRKGSRVNVEFDVIGKYVVNFLSNP